MGVNITSGATGDHEGAGGDVTIVCQKPELIARGVVSWGNLKRQGCRSLIEVAYRGHSILGVKLSSSSQRFYADLGHHNLTHLLVQREGCISGQTCLSFR